MLPPGPARPALRPWRSVPAGGGSAGHASQASNSLRRPPKEKVPFSPLPRQYGGVPAGRQSVAGRLRPRNGRTVKRQAAQNVTAGGGTRTHTDLRPGAFEAPSSTIPTLRRRGEYIRVPSL